MKFSIPTVIIAFLSGVAVSFLNYNFNIATVIISIVFIGIFMLSVLEDNEKNNE